MSKNSKGIKRRKSESSEFKQAFEEEQAKLDFADLLFELRQQTGLNQTAFAKKVNKSRSTIARIESARMEPSFSILLHARRHSASFRQARRNQVR